MSNTPLDNFKATLARYMHFEDSSHVDVCFGTVFANGLDSSPTWLFLVGPPSSGKTAVLEPASAHPLLYALDKLTTQSLVSHHVGKDGKDPSLLPELHRKTLVIKDFTGMISMRSQDFHCILGQLRGAYDGSYASKAGIGSVKRYRSRFGVIAMVTSAIDKHRPVMTELGERFVTFRMPDVSPAEARRRGMLLGDRDRRTEMETALREAAYEVLQQPVIEARMGKAFKNKLWDVAEFVARARCHIEKHPKTNEPEIPQPEVPTRLFGQLINLTKGIAMARGKSKVDGEDARLVRRTALDSMTLKRLTLMRAFLDRAHGSLSVGEVAGKMHFPEETIRVHIRDLELLGILQGSDGLGDSGKVVRKYSLVQKDLLEDLLVSKYVG